MEETMFGYEMDKNIDDFMILVKNLKSEGQKSRAQAVLYLIERVKIAERKIKEQNKEGKR